MLHLPNAVVILEKRLAPQLTVVKIILVAQHAPIYEIGRCKCMLADPFVPQIGGGYPSCPAGRRTGTASPLLSVDSRGSRAMRPRKYDYVLSAPDAAASFPWSSTSSRAWPEAWPPCNR